jgi:hypothetical protein
MSSPWHHSVQVPVYIINFRTREASNPLTSLSGPATLALRPFAADPAAAVRQIGIRVVRPVPARLLLDYELVGDLARLRIAGPAAPAGARAAPTDGLWRHTCMEVFVGLKPAAAYLEFNFAPDGQWAAYRFSGYRAGMAPLIGIRPPRIELRTQSDRLLLSADVELPAQLSAAALRLGIAAVVENDHGQLAYWALDHAADRPDFHRPESFGFEI